MFNGRAGFYGAALTRPGQALQGFTRQPVLHPVVEGSGAKPFVEVNRGLVPVQHRPVEATVATLNGHSCQSLEQGFSDTPPPELGQHNRSSR